MADIIDAMTIGDGEDNTVTGAADDDEVPGLGEFDQDKRAATNVAAGTTGADASDAAADRLADLNVLDTGDGAHFPLADGGTMSFDGLSSAFFEADDSPDAANTGTGSFAELDLLDADDGAILFLADGGTLTFEGLQAAQLGELNMTFTGDEDLSDIANVLGDDVHTGTEAVDTFMVEHHGGDDMIVDFAAVDLIDISGLGIPGFDDFDNFYDDHSAVLAYGEGDMVTVDEVDMVSLTDGDFLLDT